MSRRLLASVLGLLALVLAVSATTATAADPPGVQTADQSAASGQQATAASGATQVNPTNTNISVRVLSPGDNGSVTQSNTVGSTALAGNANQTGQTASQTQAGSGGIQAASQFAGNTQLAGALSTAAQFGASNTNLPVRVGSGGGGGSVTQSNAVGSAAGAANTNGTGQSTTQTQAGAGGACCPDGGGIQTSDQSAANGQVAGAQSSATQLSPENVNISVRVLSPGNDGAVSQSNTALSGAQATNANGTTQGAQQTQASGGGPCCPSGPDVQTATQGAGNAQAAHAASSATQIGASNVNIPIRVGSPGSNGPVSQTNIVGSTAIAANSNTTFQGAGQSQAGHGAPCGCPGDTGIQTVDQTAVSLQAAGATSTATQRDASNVNAPVRVGSWGDDGSVTQANVVGSTALAGNANTTQQFAGQSQLGGAGIGIQTANQTALNGQLAQAASGAWQSGASNDNSPIRVGSPGGGGSVSQINAVGSTAIATNSNATGQFTNQFQLGGPGCPCGAGIGIQAAGQHAASTQIATALSTAVQDFGRRSECGCPNDGNGNAPVRVGSWGDDGHVLQANLVSSTAGATNANATSQFAGQTQLGHPGIAIQALGQQALSLQGAGAFSAAFQLGASNESSPLRVLSPGGGGSVIQANEVGSTALAGNTNLTSQLGFQSQFGFGGCGCLHHPIAIQALGQAAHNHQAAQALSQALQLWPENANAPTSVWSFGGAGSLLQLNAARSAAAALNGNGTLQFGGQLQI